MTKSLEDYVETIFLLLRENSEVKVSDVAVTLDVTKPSVVRAIRELTKLGLATHKPYSGIELTEKGRRVARLVLNRHVLLRNFLVKLGVGEKAADRDACLMEHILSAETLDRIREYTASCGRGNVRQNLRSQNKTHYEKPDQHHEAASGACPHAR